MVLRCVSLLFIFLLDLRLEKRPVIDKALCQGRDEVCKVKLLRIDTHSVCTVDGNLGEWFSVC